MIAELGGAILGKVVEKVSSVFKGAKAALDLLPDRAETVAAKVELAKAENQLTIALAELELERDKSVNALRAAEVQSESWLTRNYRPCCVVALVGIIVVDFGIFPMFGRTPHELPDNLWLLTGGLTGVQIIGRSAEKIAKTRARAKE